MDLRGKFIKCTSKEQGAKIIEFFKKNGYISNWSGTDVGMYYGILPSSYYNDCKKVTIMTESQVISISDASIIELPEEKTFPRLISVLKDKYSEIWETRVCIKLVDNKAVTWSYAKTFEEAEKITDTACWNNWRELDYEEPVLELTLEEVAKQFGVKEVKIKQIK